MYALLGDIVFSTASASIREAKWSFRRSKKYTKCIETNNTSVCLALATQHPEKGIAKKETL